MADDKIGAVQLPTLSIDLHETVNACLHLEKSGCHCRFLLKEFGLWQAVRTWCDHFQADGIWSDTAALLTRRATTILDSQSILSGPQACQSAQCLRLEP